MRKYIFIILCTLSVRIFSVSAQDTSDSNGAFSDETQIYAIYLNDFIELRTKSEWKSKEKILLVIKDKTYMFIPKDPSVQNKYKDEKNHYEFLAGLFKGSNILPDTFDDFWVKNQEPSTLNSVIPVRYEYTFITDELEIQTTGGDWEIFYKRFPNAELLGITTLSRVGFNKDKTQAFLYSDFLSGPVNGAGHYILFEKINDKWNEVSRFRCWIS
jgi:hypothetical protein